MLDDVLAGWLTPDQVRSATVGMLILSAFLTGFISFALTPGAGFHCYRAFLRAAHRFSMVMLAIGTMYLAAFIQVYQRPVTGPFLVFISLIFLNTFVSSLRLLLAPTVPRGNRWPWYLSRADLRLQYPGLHKLFHGS
jgi:hypothetical protein